MKAIWENNTPYSKFLITVGIILLSAVLFTLISTIMATLIYGISMAELQVLVNDPSKPAALSIFKIVQTVSATGTFLVPPFILAWLFSRDPMNYLSLKRTPMYYSAMVVILIMLGVTPLINFLGEINSQMHLPAFLKSVEVWMKQAEDRAGQLTDAFLKMETPGDFLFNILMIGLLPAVGEELVFRGIVQKLFQQWSKNTHVAIWSSAFIFSAMHMQFYGFIPRMALGGMLGYMLAWSGSLWFPILGHFVNNAGAVVFMYLFQRGITDIDPDKIGTESDYAGVVFSLAVTVVLLFALYNREKKLIGSRNPVAEELT